MAFIANFWIKFLKRQRVSPSWVFTVQLSSSLTESPLEVTQAD